MPEQSTRTVRHADATPTGRQVFALAHALADVAGIEWPQTRGAMSDLLERVREQRDATLREREAAATSTFDAGF
jgi:hypothetical protein